MSSISSALTSTPFKWPTRRFAHRVIKGRVPFMPPCPVEVKGEDAVCVKIFATSTLQRTRLDKRIERMLWRPRGSKEFYSGEYGTLDLFVSRIDNKSRLSINQLNASSFTEHPLTILNLVRHFKLRTLLPSLDKISKRIPSIPFNDHHSKLTPNSQFQCLLNRSMPPPLKWNY